jgi:hypothetical protein
MAISAASWHMAVISAPEHPLVCESHVLIRRNQTKWTYEGSKRIEIERRVDGHVARADTENIYATSEIRWSHVQNTIEPSGTYHCRILAQAFQNEMEMRPCNTEMGN